ncbi:MAG: GNAT family N-acetyltransferase [Sphaerochaetaceae bacterium]
MEFTVSPIQDQEKAQTFALMENCFSSSYRRIFFLHPETTLVAKSEDMVIGGMNMDVYTLRNGLKIGYLGWLYTDERYRGQGVASSLLENSLRFLKEKGCSDVIACVEGDNSSSFKELAHNGFSIMSLGEQLFRFGIGIGKVNRHASRFFDMGYFLWHLQLGTEKAEQDNDQSSFFTTILINTLLWIPCLKGWNLMHYLFPRLVEDASHDWVSAKSALLLFLIPALALSIRTFSMKLSAKIQNTKVQFLGWDTAWLLAVIFPFVTGFPFPVPGNIYIKGYHWCNSDMDGVLCKIARMEQIWLALFCLFFRNSIALRYCFNLLILDCLFYFYPFTGFNASRVKKRGMAAFVTPVVTTICVAILTLT